MTGIIGRSKSDVPDGTRAELTARAVASRVWLDRRADVGRPRRPLTKSLLIAPLYLKLLSPSGIFQAWVHLITHWRKSFAHGRNWRENEPLDSWEAADFAH